MPPELQAISSVGAIILVTAALVAGLKNWLVGCPGNCLAKCPLFVFAAVISAGLVLVGKFVTHTLNGDTGQLVVSAIVGAIGAVGYHVSGLLGIGQSANQANAASGFVTIGNSTRLLLLALLPAALLGLTACSGNVPLDYVKTEIAYHNGPAAKTLKAYTGSDKPVLTAAYNQQASMEASALNGAATTQPTTLPSN